MSMSVNAVIVAIVILLQVHVIVTMVTLGWTVVFKTPWLPTALQVAKGISNNSIWLDKTRNQ